MKKKNPFFCGEIFKSLNKFRRQIYSLAFFTVVINLLVLVPAVYMLQVYDRVLPSRNIMTLVMLTLMVLFLFCIMGLLEYVRSMVLIRMGSAFDKNIAERVYNAVFTENLQRNATDASHLLSELATLRQFLTGSAVFAFFDAPWFPIYLIIISLFNPWMGLFALMAVMILIALSVLNRFLTRKPLKEANHFARVSAETSGTGLHNAEVIHAMGMLPALTERWKHSHDQYIAAQSEASDRSAAIASSTKTFRIVLQSLVLGLGALLVIEEQISAGMMIAGSILLGRTLAPIEQIIAVWGSWSQARTACEHLNTLLDNNPPRPSGMPLPPPSGKLVCEGIVASIPGGSKEPLIKNVSFSLSPGQVLGITGPSGSGKSTLVRLLAGIWPVSRGAVRLDGADIYQWDKTLLGPAIGYLPQNVELFAGSVAENISRFGHPDPDKIVRAARLAGVHDIILSFPRGYETQLTHQGGGLSGGQKQLIALARALYGDPALVILDEPNSSLDDAGERALHHAVGTLRAAGSSVVLVSHRAGIISATTHLLVLDAGTLLASGPTQQVLQALHQRRKQTAPVKPQGEPADEK